jgi:phage shock protein PspC (stress-responsive transcriptional regulator)
MNKTVNINLAGVFFHIDEDAYLKLSRYLEAIKRSFTDSQGRSEIIADIEARIAELFSERIQNQKQVVGIKLVDEVISIMGQPEDYLVDDEIFEDEPQPKYNYQSKPTKKLFRDTDNSYIGGVSAGLGHYLGIDVLWVRLLWILLTIGSGGTFIFIYLIFWALVPEAKTTAEKLTMTGDAVNISNIEKKIKDGIDTVSEKVRNVDLKKQGDRLKEGFDHVSDNISESVKNVDFQKQGNRLKSSSQTFFDTIGNILMFFLKVAAKFIGIILILVGIGTLLTLIVAFFTVGITDAVHFPPMNFIDAANAANIPMWLMSMLLLFAIGIPFFFVFYLGLKILVNNLKSIGNVAKFTLVGLWLIAIIGLIITGIKQATEHAFDANINETTQLNIKANDTLKLSMVSHNGFNNYFYRSSNNYQFLGKDDGRTILSNDIRLIIRSTKDSLASINIEKEASGSNYDIARRRAQNINYGYALVNQELKLDAFLTTGVDNKFSEQQVMVILYLPENTILYADDNTHSFHQNSSYYNDILDSGMEEHYLRVIEDDVECLDCINSMKNDEEDTSEIRTINEEDPEVRIRINEKEGVNIEVNDN